MGKQIQYANTPITPAQWGGFNDKQKWDVKAALRGPDCHEAREGIKFFTSAVIRGRCREAFRCGGTINTELGLVVTPREVGGFLWNAQHFFEHVEEAALILGLPVLKITQTHFLHHAEALGHSGKTITLQSLHQAIVNDHYVAAYYQQPLMVLRSWLAAHGAVVTQGKWEEGEKTVPAGPDVEHEAPTALGTVTASAGQAPLYKYLNQPLSKKGKKSGVAAAAQPPSTPTPGDYFAWDESVVPAQAPTPFPTQASQGHGDGQ